MTHTRTQVYNIWLEDGVEMPLADVALVNGVQHTIRHVLE